MDTFQDQLAEYKEQHRTVGCKITHMIGVPLIAISPVIWLVDWRLGLLCVVVGWLLQLVGHYVFEKNKPVFLGDPLNPFTYLSAIVFVTQEWGRFLTGKSLAEPVPINRANP